MSTSPLITVVMPLLNASALLPASLHSLAEQRWRDFEVVLVDGGSRDGSCELADRLLSQAGIRHRIELLSGSGIYDAMNHGVDCARAEWLYVMGADDRLLGPDVLAQMSSHLMAAADDVLVVHGDVWIEDPGYRYGQVWNLARFMERNISHQSAFYRRSQILRLGIHYNPIYPLYADWDYNIHVFSKGRYEYVPVAIASYACTGTSANRIDQQFMADKEFNALRYFGWRACWLLPPYRFALACAGRPSLLLRLQFLFNRLVWLLRRGLRRSG